MVVPALNLLSIKAYSLYGCATKWSSLNRFRESGCCVHNQIASEPSIYCTSSFVKPYRLECFFHHLIYCKMVYILLFEYLYQVSRIWISSMNPDLFLSAALFLSGYHFLTSRPIPCIRISFFHQNLLFSYKFPPCV